MTQVPILRIPFDDQDRQFIHDGMDDILDSGFLTLGKWTTQFEEMFAAFAGTRHCVAVNSGTAALEVILRALGIQDASVIVPTNTFLATGLAAIHAGNRIIFADSDRETLSLDVADVERRITADTKAVILVHIGGIMSPAWKDLKALCDRRGLYLIEDCAHAHGSSIDGQPAGSLGVAGAFSFFPTKVLTTGEGGAIVTDDEELFRKSRMIRNQGKNPDVGNRISELGHNFRMSEFNALVATQQMRKADSILEERRSIAEFYDRELVNIEGLRPLRTFGPSGYYKYLVSLAEGIDRDQLKSVMRADHGVSLTGEVYAELCHDEPLWDSFTYCGKMRNGSREVCDHKDGVACTDRQTGFPNAEYISRSHICLPVYPGLSEEQLGHVVRSLEATLRQIA
ncbi:MAG: DegT/DnrJ/EryC1/StrS family aminotransferase [Chloroflexi bacterium]|nr:DegT/DnrJ/EryC1/StrS family aminotransferase [Chloroflexota bacterium]